MPMLGKLPYANHPRATRPSFREFLGRFAEIGGLPKLNDTCTWKRNIGDTAWGMLLNNRIGDCTIAAACHMMMCWSDNTRPAPWSFTDQDAEDDYNDYRTSGDGASMQNILFDWMIYGIHRRDGANKIAVTIDDYAPLDINNESALKPQVQRSIQLLGGCYMGIVLPKFAVHYDNGSAVPQGNSPPNWDVTAAQLQALGPQAAKDPKAGHSVSALGYDQNGLQVVTWGEVTTMSWDFFFAYREEAWAVLCKQAWLKPDGTTPSGLTAAQLVLDFDALKPTGAG